MSTASREVRLVARPHGEPTPEQFALVDVEVPDPAPGEVLVRNLAMSVDPYMRGRMNAGPSYAPPWELGVAAQGGAVGRVVASAAPGVAEGAIVVHGLGWREHAVLPAEQVRVLDDATTAGLPLTYHLGVLGMVGLTAYAGLFDVAGFRAGPAGEERGGDGVFVSGAAGAVGGLVGQFARLRGASRVIGSAGTAAKVRFLLDELGFDAAFDYHAGPVREQLRAAAPDGIDVYFDNVGGDHLEAALDVLREHGRAALCGAISSYNATSPPPGPDNMFLAVGKRLTLRGFIVGDHAALRPQFEREVGDWLRDGRLVVRETVTDGLDHAVEAFIAMLRGANTGKAVVRLADPAETDPR